MSEQDPVGDDELVYRRIHPDFFDPNLPIPVQPRAFRPSQSDDTGLSLFRALFAQPQDTLPPHTTKSTPYYVARLAVRDVRGLRLNIVAEPLVGGPLGHAGV